MWSVGTNLYMNTHIHTHRGKGNLSFASCSKTMLMLPILWFPLYNVHTTSIDRYPTL